MHAPQTRKILQSGARILNISNEHPQALARLVPDESLKERVKNAARQCRESKEMIVSSNAGSHLSVDISTAPSVGIWGFTDRPGTLSHWPGGIVVCFPQEKTVNGVLVFEPGDINLTFKRYFDSKVIFHIEEDYVTRIEGDNLDARLMREYLHSFAEPEAWATSHVGWGLNAGARYEALAMYDKNDINGTELRALAGNFLFSTGANEFAKRYTRGHFDLPMMGCTIRLDNVCVVSDGKLC
jgi:2,5-dihydroxypyridine 5,6-dioxygenase